MVNYVIIDSKGKLIKEEGKVLFFEYPSQAHMYIEKHCWGSPYLRIKKWRKK